jgi:hypothetical protein
MHAFPARISSSSRVVIAALPRSAALALALLAAGCANFSAISPGDSSRQVEAQVGAPSTVWKSADGSEVWEYPRGPSGVQTFMVAIGADQRVQRVSQVLSEEYFTKIHAGMSREEVHRLLGRPKEIWYFSLRDEETWSWRYQEEYVRPMFFNVHFDAPSGTVRTVSRVEEFFPSGRGSRH